MVLGARIYAVQGVHGVRRYGGEGPSRRRIDCVDIEVDAYCRLARWEIWGSQIMSVIAHSQLETYSGNVRNKEPVSATHHLYLPW